MPRCTSASTERSGSRALRARARVAGRGELVASRGRVVTCAGWFVACVSMPACGVFAARPAHEAFPPFWRPPGTQEVVYQQTPVPLRMLVYPPSRSCHAGVVIFVHGGGWSTPGPDLPYFGNWSGALAGSGLRAVSIEHRILPRWKGADMLQDVGAAVSYVARHHAKLRAVAGRIALVGFSSGGHLAALTGLRRSSGPLGAPTVGPHTTPPVQAIVAYYSPLDPPTLYIEGSHAMRTLLRGLVETARPTTPESAGGTLTDEVVTEMLRSLSPLEALRSRAPRFFVVHGRDDRLVPVAQSRAFVRRAQKWGVTVDYRELPNMGHNLDASRSRRARRLEREAAEFIAEAIAAVGPGSCGGHSN